MGRNELIAFSFILVYGVSSFPWPRPQNQVPTATMMTGNSTAANKTLPDSKSVKFPNTTRRPTDNVRSPPGGWVRDRRPFLSNNSRASMAILPPEEGGIVFPDDGSDEKVFKFTPKIDKRPPECSTDATFCEVIDDYPSTYLEGILQNTALEFRSMFGNDFVEDSSIVHRIDNGDENPLCASSEQVVYPKTAKNKNDKWLFVVNQGEYTQGVRIEKCLKTGNSPEGQSCAFTESFPYGYKTHCKQKYIYRKLLALNEKGEPVSDTFQLPSCCSCSVKADSSLRSRLGSPGLRSPLPKKMSTTTVPPKT